MPEEFCNKTFTSLSPPNLALHVATVTCKASNNLRACQTGILSKVIKQYNQVKSVKREVCASEQMFEVLSISSHTGAQPSMPLVDGLVDNTLLQTRVHTCMRQSGTASSATEQHLSWYSTIEKISDSNQ